MSLDMPQQRRPFRRREDIYEEWQFLRDWHGMTDEDIAERLGYRDVRGLQLALDRFLVDGPSRQRAEWEEVVCSGCGARGWTRDSRPMAHYCGTRNWDVIE